MVLTSPISWSAKYSAIHTWVFGATGIQTRWSHQDDPRPDFPYVLLQIIGSAKEGGLDEVTETTDLTRARDVKVTPIAQDSTTYSITISGTLFTFLSDASATIAEITAGLKLAIDAGSEPVVVTDNGTDLDIVGGFETLNPTVPQLFTIVVTDDFDGLQISRANNDTGNEVEQRVTGSREFTLNVQAFARNTRTDNAGTDPARNSRNTLSILRTSLGLPSVQTQLRAADISIIEELPFVDLSAPTEDTLLNRTSMDVRMRTLAVLLEHTGFITDVAGTATYAGTADSPIADTYSVTS